MLMGGIANRPKRPRVLGYRESQVVAFMLHYYLEYRCAPTSREIQDGVGINSKGEVARILQRIEKCGFTRLERAATRGPRADERQHANLRGQKL